MGLKLISDSIVHFPAFAPEAENGGSGDVSMYAAHRNMGSNVDDMRGKAIKWAANQDVVTCQIARLVGTAPTHDRLFRREGFENMRKRINAPVFSCLIDKTFQLIGSLGDGFFFPRLKIRHNPSFRSVGRKN